MFLEWQQMLNTELCYNHFIWQLVREFKRGRTFQGWSEGTLNFPPTYKYEMNSNRYRGEDPKVGRRTPAWCVKFFLFTSNLVRDGLLFDHVITLDKIWHLNYFKKNCFGIVCSDLNLENVVISTKCAIKLILESKSIWFKRQKLYLCLC